MPRNRSIEGSEQVVSTEAFSIRYEGRALETGRMDVRDLAPALLAMGKLCEEANRELNGSKARVSLQVKADFVAGSFEATLHLAVTWFDQLKGVLLGGPKDAKDVLEILGFYASLGTGALHGVLRIVHAVGTRRVQESKTNNDGSTTVIFDNSTTLIVDSASWDLYRQKAIIDNLDTVVKPLEDEGVREITFKRGPAVEETITKDDLASIEAMRANSVDSGIVNESTITRLCEVVSASANPEHIWRLTDGETEYRLRIDDAKFFDKITTGEWIISLGDLLRVVIQSETRLEQGQLKTRSSVIEVKDHQPGNRINERPPRLLDEE